jgi:Ca-activated chloride channel family protein
LRFLTAFASPSNVFLVVCCLGFVSAAEGQKGPKLQARETVSNRITTNRSEDVPKSHLRFKVQQVAIPVGVTDELYRPITALPEESFRVFEDGVEQRVVSFRQEDGPVSLGLLFDTSGSMKDRIDASAAALKKLLLTTLPGDEFFLVQFSDQAQLLSSFVPPDLLFASLRPMEPKGWTALLDAIALGATQMKTAQNPRRVLLILSDGSDNNSRFSESEIRSMVLEADLRVYSIALFNKPRVLQHLADVTGGNVLLAQNLNELDEIVEKLSAEIRSQYLLSYSPTNQRNDGKYRRVKVELARAAAENPRLRLTWRRGYYAPIE